MRKLQAHTGSTSAPPRLPGNGGGVTPACWNCGSLDHLLPDCPRPRDESRIERARQRFRASNPRRFRGKPRRKTSSDGKPLILNKNGHCALDQKRWRATSSVARGVSAPSSSAPSFSHANAVRSALASGQLS